MLPCELASEDCLHKVKCNIRANLALGSYPVLIKHMTRYRYLNV